MIPARMGSERLKQKNLALINGRPMISYAIDAAVKSGAFTKVQVNSDGKIFKKIAEDYGADFFLREEDLAGSTIKADDVVYDFIKNFPGDVTVWLNTTSPLQTAEEIKNVMDYFFENDLDSLITTRKEYVHSNYDGKPLNYSIGESFSKTQDLIPVERFCYSIMAWKNDVFMKEYEEKGHAMFCGKTGTFEISKEASLIVKHAEDLKLIDAIVRGRENQSDEVEYYSE